jgi:integral membrane protein
VLRTPIGRIRLAGMVEGVSFLVLLGIAMPLKYFADLPMAVRYVGWAHGVLFLGFCAALAQALLTGAVSFGRSFTIFAAALVPFGPFVIDRSLAQQDAASRD